jgi:poly-beta-1,6-N-acetyl-D-glucosamine biosynthesis protein PgaD
MTAQPPANWPPLITDARRPRAIVWRDRALTAAAWLLLFFMLRRGLSGLWDETLELFGRVARGPGIDWIGLWDSLSRYLTVAGLLCLWLFAWSLVTQRRRRRLAGTTAPAPLTLADHAHDAGCSEADLAAWRSWRIMVVHIDENDRISVVPRDAAPGAVAKEGQGATGPI